MRMAATAAVYNRLHNTSVGVVGGGLGSATAGVGGSGGTGLGHHHQLARSLERILEEAHLSGELILTNRKLKDFPKTGTKYNLNDTVIAGKLNPLFFDIKILKNSKVSAIGCGRMTHTCTTLPVCQDEPDNFIDFLPRNCMWDFVLHL